MRVCPEIAARAADTIAKRSTSLRTMGRVGKRLLMVAVAVAALNAGVAYAGEYECSYESSSPPPNDTFSSPSDANNSQSLTGGFGTYESYQDTNNMTGLLVPSS